MVDERIDVYLHHCIALVVAAVAVGGVIRVEAVFSFPFVRHTVAVGINRRRLRLQCGPCLPVVGSVGRAVVVGRVNDARGVALALTGVGGRTIAGVAYHQFVVAVAYERRAGIVEHTVVGILGRVGGDVVVFDRFGKVHAVLVEVILRCVVAVLAVDLQPYTIIPVVAGDISE